MSRTGKILIAAVVVGAGAFAIVKFRNAKAAAPEIRSATVTRGNMAITIQATGVVQPQNRVEIKPPIPGRVEDVLVQEGDQVKKGQVLAWMSSTERAALLDVARAKGPAELKHWEELYRPAPLVAPLTGVIIARNVEPGQTVASTDAILVMSNRLIVKAQVDETDIGKVRLQEPAETLLDAYPTQPIEGAVDQIAYEAKTVNNVTIYEVDIAPTKVEDFMRSGMTANVTFFISKKENILMLPAEAVVPTDNGGFVLVAGPDGKPTRQPVELGASDGKQTEIVSGLNEGDKVIVKTLRMGGKQAGGTNPFNPMGRRPAGGQRSGGGGGR